ncbi:spore germination protein GerPE [Bacillus sp. 1P02SD]|uniref:spore germination protein GerPE n=1 Tax=Bacillus sp. 1P02SD TaxID=3132264 RepID=UPI0039A1A5A0
MKRLSVVDYIRINAVLFSSIVEVGDTRRIAPFTQALAFQKEVPLFFSNEGSLSAFPFFKRELPKVKIEDEITMNTFHQNPVIKVNTVRILGISSSSVLQIGSTVEIESKSKVKHIRKLLEKQPTER